MLRPVRRQTVLIGIFLVVVLLFVTTFRMGVVRGTSMAPTYADGQVVLVRRKNPFSGPLHRNDVVLLRQARDVIIKRIYRLPGEEVDESHPELLRMARTNGRIDYYEQETFDTPEGQKTRYRVPEGFLVILGDNPRASEDSRAFGPVPLRDVLGVVISAPPPPEAGSLSMPPARESQQPEHAPPMP